MTTISNLTSQLFSTLFQGGGGARTPGPGDAIVALKTANKTQTRDIAALESRSDVKADLERFEKAVQSAKSPDELLRNRDALKVLLTASGLEGQIDQGGLIRKALTSVRSEKGSLINQLAASNLPLARLANRLKFDTQGLAIVQSDQTLAAFRTEYLDALRRQQLEKLTPGINAALQFQKKASSITRTIDILADPDARAVVTGALGLPQELAYQSVDTQARVISDRLDISRLKDPRFVEQLTQRYLLNRNGGGINFLTSA